MTDLSDLACIQLLHLLIIIIFCKYLNNKKKFITILYSQQAKLHIAVVNTENLLNPFPLASIVDRVKVDPYTSHIHFNQAFLSANYTSG